MPNKPQIAVEFRCFCAVGEQESFCCATRWWGLPLHLSKARCPAGQSSFTLLYRGLCLHNQPLWPLLKGKYCVGLISEECIPRKARLLVPQCLQGGFLHAAATEVALPFSSPCLPTQGSVRRPQHCKPLSAQFSYHLPVTPVTKKDCRWTLSLILYQLHIRVHLVVLLQQFPTAFTSWWYHLQVRLWLARKQKEETWDLCLTLSLICPVTLGKLLNLLVFLFPHLCHVHNYSSLSLGNALKSLYKMQHERGSYHYFTLVKYWDVADNKHQAYEILCI